jgi:nucleotide-binding universal stress UspA family protein
MKLLLPLDFSDASKAILKEVAWRPWPKATSAHIIHVVDTESIRSALVDTSPYLGVHLSAAECLVSSAAQQLSSRGIEATTLVTKGHPLTYIPAYAKEIAADVVLVGSHGESALKRFLMGSVAKAVLRHAPCSVEIVRPPAQDWGMKEGMRILLATDGSDCSNLAAHSVADRAWPVDSVVKIIRVVEPRLLAIEASLGAAYQCIEDEERKQAKAGVKETEGWMTAAGIRAVTTIASGHVRASIIDGADAWNADLVVVGSHGRRGLSRMLLGSVAETVALYAHCSVEVVRSGQ